MPKQKKLTPTEALTKMQKAYDEFHRRLLILKKRTTILILANREKRD